MNHRTNLTSLVLLGVLTGCGATLAPQELKQARDAYQRAKGSEVAELAPAQLEEARQALERAEASFEKHKDDPETLDLAYVALRQVEIAGANAALEAAQREKAAAEKKLEELREKLQETTEKRLDKTKEELDAERRAAEREREKSARELADKEREKSALAAETATTRAALEQERKAREAAEKRLAAALASLEKIAQVKEEKRGIVITLSGAVLFATGKHDLLPIAEQKLDDVAKALKDQGYKKIVVEGHTDSRGSDTANLELSKQRAESVRTYLVSRGIDGNKITAVGVGEARPVADNNSPEGRANNRRVELVVTPE